MQRLLVKFGTACLIGRRGKLSQAIFDEIARQIVMLMDGGWQVVIVTSGAIQAGREEAEDSGTSIAGLHKKDLAALGSPRLMEMWRKAFRKQGRIVGQIWITHANLKNRGERKSIGESVENLLGAGILPILDENDAVSDREIRSMEKGISENDRLTYLLSWIVNPDAVLSVTAIGGVFDRFPITRASKIYRELTVRHLPEGLAESGVKTEVGTGGMNKKILELGRCRRKGRRVGISGWKANGIIRFAEGEEVGTLLGRQNRLSE